MLNETEFLKYCSRLALPEPAIKYIQRVHTSGPSRKVRSGSNNVVAHYPSKKMGRMVAVESHTVELAFTQQIEHDDGVIEYYAQPEPIKLTYVSASGRPVGVIHTPDFFLLEREAAGWVECKTEEDLQKLCKSRPNRYCADGEGGWLCPPGKACAKPFGFYYRVWSTAAVSPIVLRNLHFLEDYFDPEYPDLPAALKSGILETVKRCPGIRAQKLVEEGYGCTYEHVYTLIGKGSVYADLKAAPLTSSGQVQLFVDEQTAVACRFADLSFKSHSYAPTFPLDETKPRITITIPPDVSETPVLSDQVVEALRSTTPRDLAIANKRFEIIREHSLTGPAVPDKRTLCRWHRAYRLAEEALGCGYIGLFPKDKLRGNRTHRLPEEIYEIADQVIKEHYESAKRKSYLLTHGVLQIECEKRGWRTPTRKWLWTQIRRRQNSQTVQLREGNLLPEKSEAALLTKGILAHGERPWDVVHLDHTLCDIELVDEETGLLLGRPWLTIAFDAFSRRVLGFYLSFDHPSYRSCLMAMRECGRRHGRVPSCLVVDGGSEFRHLYFESFCARYQITLKIRPAPRPYFGSVIEKMFGTLATQFFQNLAGSTHILKSADKITAANNPHKEAVWTLERLHALLCEYCYEIYDHRIHSGTNMTPATKYERGMELGGLRPTRQVEFDEEFIAMTMPTTPSSTARIYPSRGVSINHIYYWSDEMRGLGLAGQQAPVRYDPYNLAVAYVYLSDRWVRCISVHAEAFRGRSEKELQLASTKLMKANRIGHQQHSVSARKLAEFFMSVEGEERLRKLHRKNLAAQRATKSKPNLVGSALDFAI